MNGSNGIHCKRANEPLGIGTKKVSLETPADCSRNLFLSFETNAVLEVCSPAKKTANVYKSHVLLILREATDATCLNMHFRPVSTPQNYHRTSVLQAVLKHL